MHLELDTAPFSCISRVTSRVIKGFLQYQVLVRIPQSSTVYLTLYIYIYIHTHTNTHIHICIYTYFHRLGGGMVNKMN